MGFFLTDVINSALTPRGTNARNAQQEGNQAFANFARDLLGSLRPGLESQFSEMSRYAPARSQRVAGLANFLGYRAPGTERTPGAPIVDTTTPGYRSFMAAISPGNRMARAQGIRNQVLADENDAVSRFVASTPGLSPATVQGLSLGAMNRATSAGNQYRIQQSTPQAEAEAANLQMNAFMQELLRQLGAIEGLDQAIEPSQLRALERLAGINYGAPAVQVQQNPLSGLLGQGLGLLLGGGLGGASGGAAAGSGGFAPFFAGVRR